MGRGGLLGGCCGSVEACKEERGGDDETPGLKVLSLKRKISFLLLPRLEVWVSFNYVSGALSETHFSCIC